MKQKNRGFGGFSTLLIILFVLGLYWFVGQMGTQEKNITYQYFLDALEKGTIEAVVIEQDKAVPTGHLRIEIEDEDSVKVLNVSDVNEIQDLLSKAGVENVVLKSVPEDSWFMTTLIPTLLMIVALIFVFMMLNRPTGANAKAMNFGRNRAKMSNPSDKHITFAKVAGLQEEKEELEEIVDFLKSPKKYMQVGARIPKGVLLVGPPGTGKT